VEYLYPYRSVQPGEVHYGGTLTFDLGAYEQRVLELAPRAKDCFAVEGIRFAAEKASGSNISLAVYAPAGSAQTFRVSGAGVQSVVADGQPAASSGGEVKLEFAGTSSELTYARPLLTVSRDAQGRTLRATETVDVPADFQEARLAFLIEPEREMRNVTAEAHDGGRAVTPAIENGGRGAWHWISMELTPGKHQLDLTVRVPSSPGELKVSAWLLSKRQLAKKELKIGFKPGTAAGVIAPNLLPDQTPFERQTALLLRSVIP
jgi:hypothetical protein